MGVTGYTEIMGETGMEILTNEERLDNLIDKQFTNLYEPWDNSFLLIEDHNDMVIYLDGEYKNPNFSINIEPTEIQVMLSYRDRVNKLIVSLLL